ncbi:SirB1 family protein [Ferruginivarius sediminum]|uniref:Protein SirB1 N-terminal domain-containing protein n=1 Tax=Ferruginivarius sediminum TaxID=2661937 RepID=A0A369TCV4_9PROT|nr:transglutaminase-like domain-containing protein [Ferruginivarius sediminum]RDD63120.1 hypothetical protein DRB17_04940 [Ferruginivarius sediminum]
MTPPREAEEILRGIAGLDDRDIDLSEGALALAALETPERGLAHYRHHLSLLSRDAADLAGDDPAPPLARRLAILRTVLVERYGYHGDRETYDDLQNANLMRVIDRRRGLPVALGILYIHTARAQGWEIGGINFPGHFLLRLDAGGERAVVDPFTGLTELSAQQLRSLLKAVAGEDAELDPSHYETIGNQGILLRLQNNRKLRLLKAQQADEAIGVIEGMLMFAPGEPRLWREAGLLHAHQGNLRAATTALEQFVELSDDPAKREEARELIAQLRSRLN